MEEEAAPQPSRIICAAAFLCVEAHYRHHLHVHVLCTLVSSSILPCPAATCSADCCDDRSTEFRARKSLLSLRNNFATGTLPLAQAQCKGVTHCLSFSPGLAPERNNKRIPKQGFYACGWKNLYTKDYEQFK